MPEVVGEFSAPTIQIERPEIRAVGAHIGERACSFVFWRSRGRPLRVGEAARNQRHRERREKARARDPAANAGWNCGHRTYPFHGTLGAALHGCTVSVTVAECWTDPPLAVTVTMYAPVGVPSCWNFDALAHPYSAKAMPTRGNTAA